MTRLEKVQAALPAIQARLAKADQLDAVVAAFIQMAIQMADGDPAKLAYMLPLIQQYLGGMEIRPWVTPITVNPGDLVYDASGKHFYMYVGKNPMTHTNSSQAPSDKSNIWLLIS